MNTTSLFFSIIMPCYNSAAYVRNAIESLLAQTYVHWELIAINDGSMDETLQILNEYADCDERIKVFTKENGGYSSAINYGLDKISGDYFLMMGSDDSLGANLFLSITERLQNRKPDLIGFRTVRVVDGQKDGLDRFTQFENEIFLDESSINEYEGLYPQESEIFFVRDTSKCYKTDLLGDLRYFGKYGYDADGIFSMLFARKSRSFFIIPIDGYYWTLRSDSVSAKTNFNMDVDRLNNWDSFYNLLLKEEDITLTKHEVKYIRSFYGVICSVIKSPKMNEEYKSLVNKGRKTIIRAIKEYKLARYFFVNGKRILLLNLPVFWYYEILNR